MFWDKVPSGTGTTQLPVSSLSHTGAHRLNPLLPCHPHSSVKAQRYQNPRGVTPNPIKHRRAPGRPKSQMFTSPPRKETPALGRGLMEEQEAATSCRRKSLGCLHHQHLALTICSASIFESAGAQRSADPSLPPSLPTAERGDRFLLRGSAGSAPHLGSGIHAGLGIFLNERAERC